MNTLFPFQQTGADWLAARVAGVLADEMGLGKTVQALAAADRIGAKYLLILTPGIAREMWAREAAIWFPGRSVQILRSTADANRIHGDVLIVSYSLLRNSLPQLRARQHDVLIADEGQNLKSIAAARTRAVYARDGLIHCVKRVWLLSGTLAPNNPSEYWVHYRCLFKGKLNYWPFVERYCVTRQTPFGQQIVGTNPARIGELAAILGPFMLQRRLRDVLPDLPPLRWGHTVVSSTNVPPMPDLTVEQQAVLGRMERGEAVSILDQTCLASLRRHVGIAKSPAVIELIQAELEGHEKIVVFGLHREVLSTIATGLGSIAAVIDGDTPQGARQALIGSFQNSSSPRVLVLQLTIAGTALTLHRAHRVIFAESSWVPADMSQAAARLHRLGQTKSVLASVVSLAGSIDERVNGVVMRKGRELAALENMIREEAVA